jgi:hypothetical protein
MDRGCQSRILSVVSDNHIIIAERYKGVTAPSTNYSIVRLDQAKSGISNVIDRLPTLSITSSENITDNTCYSDEIDMGYDSGECIITTVKNKIQDPLNAWTNDFVLGNSTIAKRGRNDFRLTAGQNSSFKLGDGRAYLVYTNNESLEESHNKKVVQFYIFVRSGKSYQVDNPDLMGRVYLLALSSESLDSSKNVISPFNNKDVVDIFELKGRPIIKM